MKFLVAIGIGISLLSTGSARARQELKRDPAEIYFPKNYKNGEKWPLVVLLHAYKVSGGFQKFYFGLSHRLKKDGFILFVPGTVRDSQGHRFWNAMDYCCNSERLPVDDITYLKAEIERVMKENPVDPDRVYLLGHSNGAMMAHRMACDHADLFAGIASLAGSGMRELSQCKPSSPVSILEIHARNDKIVLYDGMTEASLKSRLKTKPLYPYAPPEELVRYPSAGVLVRDWATKNGCDLSVVENDGPKNYALSALGRETTKEFWKTGCRKGTEVGLWTLKRGGHVPRFNGAFSRDVLDFLLAQKKVRN